MNSWFMKKAYLELLAELENDARQNLSQIAEKFEISRLEIYRSEASYYRPNNSKENI